MSSGRRSGGSDEAVRDHMVVDLRGDEGAKVSRVHALPTATPSESGGRDAPSVDTGSSGARSGAAAAGPVGQPGRLSRRVLMAFLPLAGALVAALAIALGTAALINGAVDDVVRHDDGATTAEAAANSIRQVRATVLETVAGGVGEQLSTVDDISRQLGAAEQAVATGPRSLAADLSSDAVRSHEAYLAAVSEAIERSPDPVELGNALGRLDALHQEAADAWGEVAAAERRGAERSADTARRTLLVGLILTAGALAAAIGLLVLVRRRLQLGLDRPVSALRSSIRAIARGRSPVGVQGFPELVALSGDLVEARADIDSLRREAAEGERERQLLEALEFADSERAAYAVVDRALADTGHPVELLLAPRGTTRLERVAADPDRPAPLCPVSSTGACTALRRGQVSVFNSSESINTCPYLRGRPGGPCSAVCVPVTISGRPTGVLHMTGPDQRPPAKHLADELVRLATAIGSRVGSLRTLETTRQEAATDGLTGLPNRRSFDAELAQLLDYGTPFVLVLADLDKFKRLNDTYGHEVGDRALQLFAKVVRNNVRGNDIVARIGGEEFALVYPNIATSVSLEALARLDAALAAELAASSLPEFTCSYGVATSIDGVDAESILRVADAGLLRAKELGGAQAVVSGADLAAQVFNEDD